MSPSCDTCRFWSHTSDAYGRCRRNAPSVLGFELATLDEEGRTKETALRVLPYARSFACWPTTCRADWCGEWSLKEAT